MATFEKINLYRRTTENGVSAIRPVPPSGTGGGGWTGQRQVRLNSDNVTVIYALGENVNEDQVFEVNLLGAKSFITDWAGISDLDNFVRVNKYVRTLQPAGADFEGEIRWQYFGTVSQSSVRVVPNNVASAFSIEENGVDETGEDINEECFRVTMVDGTRFVTDRTGYNDIVAYAEAP